MQNEEREVIVKFYDSDEEHHVIVVIGEWVEGEPDEHIFHYFDSEEQYQDALELGTFEFEMRESNDD